MTATKTDDKLLTPTEAAIAIKRSEARVRQLIGNGTLEAERGVGPVKIRESVVDAYVAKRDATSLPIREAQPA